MSLYAVALRFPFAGTKKPKPVQHDNATTVCMKQSFQRHGLQRLV